MCIRDSVSGEAGKEQTDAGMVVDDSSIDFTIRWCKKAAEIDSTHLRVEFNGDVYKRQGLDRPQGLEEGKSLPRYHGGY